MTQEHAQKRKRRTKDDSDYLNNKEFLEEVIKCQNSGKISNRLGEMFMILVTRYAQKPNFSGYSYIDEMKSHAIVTCIASVNKFNSEKSNNPFAYYTTIINSAFLQILNKEKAHQMKRDKLLIEANLNPSMNYDGTDDFYKEENIYSPLSDDIDIDNIGLVVLESEVSKNGETSDEKDENDMYI